MIRYFQHENTTIDLKKVSSITKSVPLKGLEDTRGFSILISVPGKEISFYYSITEAIQFEKDYKRLMANWKEVNGK